MAYIDFAYDLPNLHFLANKRFLSELAKCFEKPVFIIPLIKQLNTQVLKDASKNADFPGFRKVWVLNIN